MLSIDQTYDWNKNDKIYETKLNFVNRKESNWD